MYHLEVRQESIMTDDSKQRTILKVKSILTVYQEGYVTYRRSDIKRNTAFSIDDLEIAYEFVDGRKVIDESEYENWDAVIVLMIFAEERLLHNANSRQESKIKFHLDDDGNDFAKEASVPDFSDGILNEHELKIKNKHLLEAFSHLTDKQKQVVFMYYFQEMQKSAIARQLGISQTSVTNRLDGAEKKLKKFF